VKRLSAMIGRLLAARLVARGAGKPRPEEVEPDPTEREEVASRRSERIVIALLLLAALFGFGFVAVYAADKQNVQLLGVTVGGALLLAAVAAVVAGKAVVPQETEVEERAQLLHEEELDEVEQHLHESSDGITRRRALAAAAGVAGAGIGAAFITPAVSFGPDVAERIDRTPWERGRHLVREDGSRIVADDVGVGDFLTAFPEGADKEQLGSAVIVVRLRPAELHLEPARRGWAPLGIVAYSKICTHAGCAVSMFRHPLSTTTTELKPAFVCPCHYSTFLPGEGAKVDFGPAGRPLPQLPLMLDASRQLVAGGGYSGPPGPAWLSVRSGKPS
jgi:ubiquinol-cytochrome c reductase iron-sulfur subunit